MSFIGHERQIAYLEHRIKRGSLAHAYLFHGPEHIGKFLIARAFAFTLFSGRDRITDDYPGGSDIFILDTEHTLVSKKEKRKEIPIEDIRELKRVFSLSSSSWRIAIVNDAERMSEEASNAFLKILEEPGERTLLILVSSAPELLLPTIRSRLERIQFSSVSDLVLERHAAGAVPDRKKRGALVEFVGGCPGILMRALEEPEWFLREEKLRETVEDILQLGDIPGAFKLSERISGDKDIRGRVAGYAMAGLRRRLTEGMRDGAVSDSLISECKGAYAVLDALETTNVNPRLATDALLLHAISGFSHYQGARAV